MRLLRVALLIALLALAGCVTIVSVPIPPAPTPAPAAATCPMIALEEFTRGEALDLVRLRVANPGPAETITVDQADFRLLDTRGNTYRADSATTTLAPGQDAPVTLLGRAAEGWLTVVRWDRAPCAPVAIALPDPR